MVRIGPKNPSGFVYIVAAEGAPPGPPYYTKIGCSPKSFDDANGRGFFARFWIEALGLGKLRVDEVFHANAYELEHRVHAQLLPTDGRGKSTEVFNIDFESAVALVKRYAQEIF